MLVAGMLWHMIDLGLIYKRSFSCVFIFMMATAAYLSLQQRICC